MTKSEMVFCCNIHKFYELGNDKGSKTVSWSDQQSVTWQKRSRKCQCQ